MIRRSGTQEVGVDGTELNGYTAALTKSDTEEIR